MDNCRKLTIWVSSSLFGPLSLDPLLALICHALIMTQAFQLGLAREAPARERP